jgi:hypothetical protein
MMELQPQQIDVEIETEDPEREQERMEERLQTFGHSLAKQRDEWIRDRYSYGVDKRWIEDEDQYNGKDNINKAASQMMTSVEQGYPVTTQGAKPHRSTVFIGMTRQKTNAAEARVADILLPTDDRNWGITPTPNPYLMNMLKDDRAATDQGPVGQQMGQQPGMEMGQQANMPAMPPPQAPGMPQPAAAPAGIPAPPQPGPMAGMPMPPQGGLAAMAMPPAGPQPVTDQAGQQLRMKDVARAVMDMANKKAEAMEREIEDQLTECDYNSELRKMIHDAAVLGTGVIRGPIVTNRTRKAWQPYTDAQGQQVHQIEIVEELAPASFRVDPRNVWPDPACGENVHRGKGIYEREQVTAKQIRELAKQPGFMKAQLRKVLEEGPKRSATMQELKDEDQRDVARDLYEMWTYWGEVEHDDLDAAGVDAGEKDELKSISACVIMINSTVVKAFLNPLEGGDLPYDFYVWEKVSSSCWGYGIPYLMRSQQKVLNAAWRQMMDNAGVSSGPQIVMKPSVIQPADKQWQITSRKVWYATDDVDDVSKAFATFEFSSHQAELAGIIKMATELVDQETGVPTILQGEKGAAPDTVGGMQMLMNSANVVLRRLVKQFDDMVTRPHIRRYYDYNMLYNEDEEIKGDFSINARGSSALLIRDIQNQAFLNLLAAGANPIYGMYLDTEKLFRKALQAQHVDPTDVFKSEEEIEQIKEQQKAMANQPPPPDPRIEAANLRAQTDLQRAQMQNQGDMAEIEARMQKMQQEAQLKMAELEIQREVEMLKMSNAQNLSLEKIKAQLADTAIKERGRKELFAAEQDLKIRMGSGI